MIYLIFKLSHLSVNILYNFLSILSILKSFFRISSKNLISNKLKSDINLFYKDILILSKFINIFDLVIAKLIVKSLFNNNVLISKILYLPPVVLIH